MPVGWFVALRFMWEQRWQTLLIISGVGVGVGVLVFISALVGGLQESLIERTTGSQAHVVVTPLELEGRPVLRESPGSGTVFLRRIERPARRTALYVSVDDVYRADIVAQRIARLTGLTSKSWMETNAQLLTALRSQTASTTMIRFFVLITVAIGIATPFFPFA